VQKKYFGTDGIRGRANEFPMTAESALKIGMAAGQYFKNNTKKVNRVVIGKDTRLSGYMFENALTAGLTSMGMNVLLLGPVPTPAVGILTPSMRADLGIMISASHNPHEDNGIKFFGPDGFKLSDEAEQNIEELIGKDLRNVGLTDIGRAKRIEDGLFRYVERVKSSFPSGMRLDGMKVVIDCANGAGYRAAPEVLWELGADVIPVGVNPNGLNINKNCGSTNPQIAAEAVVSHGADVGICLDGDADRIILIDSEGNIADGDQIMGVIASRWFEDGLLTGSGIATTVMSNLGLERFLKQRGISMERTQVGDRYVVEHMRKSGFNLGGEQSGHIILSDFSTTGDGLIAGLQFLAEIIRSERGSKDLARIFEPVPQLLKNASYKAGSDPLSKPNVVKAIKAAELKLQNNGRLLIRKSGTEPLIRVMAESEDEEKMTKAVDSVVAEIIA
jgi:phosphoglucosamine mutase|tara:strand:- start:12001 stop:13338 length:1338 start_codon:yes stop_codon:yes gene_type:complete